MTNKPPILPGASPLDGLPEIPFEKEWGQLVRRARIDQGLTQTQLAAKVGVEQAMISNIETGSVKSSKAVTPIVQILNIPGPADYLINDEDRRWNELGRLLRERSLDAHHSQLVQVEALLEFLKSREPK